MSTKLWPVHLQHQREFQIACQSGEMGYATECVPGLFSPKPIPLEFADLKKAYRLTPMPFWVINASSPPYRSSLGLLGKRDEDNKSQDIFEMTAVSHGSGRYGYVPTSPALHRMSVLDAVTASAAFFDSNQQQYNSLAQRVALGFTLQVLNLDWGVDISNYNVSDSRRYLHRLLPFPFYLIDGPLARYFSDARYSEESKNRVRSAFIRLTDGGNTENLGAYSLIKRRVKNLIISDAANDSAGRFVDLCDLQTRLKNDAVDSYAKFIYLPALENFASHCKKMQENSNVDGYSLHDWSLQTPVILGCITVKPRSGERPCTHLEDDDIRLFVVKPVINRDWIRLQVDSRRRLKKCWLPKYGSQTIFNNNLRENSPFILNCESAMFIRNNWEETLGTTSLDSRTCPIFPQNSTVTMTANSSSTLFKAYRELGRQYVLEVRALLEAIYADKSSSSAEQSLFTRIIESQESHPVSVGQVCSEIRPLNTGMNP